MSESRNQEHSKIAKDFKNDLLADLEDMKSFQTEIRQDFESSTKTYNKNDLYTSKNISNTSALEEEEEEEATVTYKKNEETEEEEEATVTYKKDEENEEEDATVTYKKEGENEENSKKSEKKMNFQEKLRLKEEFIKFWAEDCDEIIMGFYTYIKDKNKQITSTLAQGGQGRVYQGFDYNRNERIVFKQFKMNHEYIREKKIYQHLQNELEKERKEEEKLDFKGDSVMKAIHNLTKDEEKLWSYVYLEGIEFNDECKVIILPGCECNLYQLAQESYKLSEENLEKRDDFHMNKAQILYIIKFIIEAMAKFEGIGIIYQDLKPQNILVKYYQKNQKTHYRLVISDFGGAFFKDQQQQDSFGYGDVYTKFFSKQSIKLKKMRMQQVKYTEEEMIEDFLYAMVRTVEVCVVVRLTLCKNEIKIGEFVEDLDRKYDLNLSLFLEECKQNQLKTFNSVLENEEFLGGEGDLQDKSYFQLGDQIIQRLRSLITGKCLQDQVSRFQRQKRDKDLVNMGIQYYIRGFYLESELLFNSVDLEEIKQQDLKILGQFYHFQGQICSNKGELEKAIEMDMKSLEVFEQVYGENAVECYGILNSLGGTYFDSGELGKAEGFYKRNLAIVEGKFGKGSVESVECLMYLGNLWLKQGQYFKEQEKIDQACEIYKRCLGIIEGKYGKNCKEAESILSHLADLEEAKGNLQEAQKMLSKSLEIEEKQNGNNSISSLHIRNRLGQIYSKLNDHDKAGEIFSECLKIQDKFYGKGNIQSITSLQMLAECYAKNSYKMEKSIKIYLKCLDILNNNSNNNNGKEKANFRQKQGILYRIGEVYQELGNHRKATEYFERSQEVLEMGSGLNSKNVEVLTKMGMAASKAGNFEKMIESYSKILQICEKQQEQEQENEKEQRENYEQTMNCLQVLGTAYKIQGEYQKAQESCEKLLQIQKKRGEYTGKQEDSLLVLSDLGDIYSQTGNFDKSIDAYQQCLKIAGEMYGENSEQYLGILEKIGFAYEDVGDFEKAQEVQSRNLGVYEGNQGQNCLQSVSSLQSLGSILGQQGKFEEAVGYFVQANDILEAEFGEFSVEYAEGLVCLGELYKNYEQYQESIDVFSQVLSIFLKNKGKDRFQELNCLDIYNSMMEIYIEQGEIEKAEEKCRQMEGVIKKFEWVRNQSQITVDLDLFYAMPLIGIGRILIVKGQLKEAEMKIDRAFGILSNKFGENSYQCAEVYHYRGEIYQSLLDKENARKYYTKAVSIYEKFTGKESLQYKKSYKKLQNL